MIHSDEVRNLDEQDEMFYLSHSYLSASEFLCDAMVNGEFKAGFGRSRVILNLCHHGLELYFKSALMFDNKSTAKGHNLKELHEAYLKSYPYSQFEIPMPFGYTPLGYGELFPEMEKDHFNSLHQKFRYSSDHKGNRWPDIEGFFPEDFLKEVSDINRKLMVVWMKIRAKNSLS